MTRLFRHPVAWMAGWALALVVLAPPNVAIGTLGDISDSSFMAVLEQGLQRHLHWGSDIAWTYGPYGALDFNLGSVSRVLLVVLAGRLLLHAALVGILAVVLWRARAAAWVWVAALLVFVVARAAGSLEFDQECMLVGLLCAWLASTGAGAMSPRWSDTFAVAAGTVLALGSLVKVSVTLAAAAIVVVVVVGHRVGRRSKRTPLLLTGSFAAAGLLLWVAAGQRLQDIPTFIRATYELVNGYGLAMAYDTGNWRDWVAALVLIVFLVIAGLSILACSRSAALFAVLCSPVAFLLFKEGFVRSDVVHNGWFVEPMTYLLVLNVAILNPRLGNHHKLPRRGLRLTCSVGVLVVVWMGMFTTISKPPWNIADRMSQYGVAVNAVLSAPLRAQIRAADVASFQELAPLPQGIVTAVSGHSVAVLPYFNATAWSYGLKPAQQPVLQTYSGYTRWLDRLDADYFGGMQAPDYVIFGDQPIDGRLEQFDEPLVVRQLLEKYSVDPSSTATWLVLRHRLPPAGTPQTRAEGRQCASLGQPIPVPHLPHRRVYAHVTTSTSLQGWVKATFFRASVLQVGITTQDGAPGPRQFRLVGATAADGLFVSGLATNATELADLFGGGVSRPITSLVVDASVPSDYSSPVCVTFESTGQ